VELIEIGRLGRPHGLEGEQGLDRCTLTIDELQAIKTFTWRGAGGEHRTLHLVSVRQAGQRMLVRFSGSAGREDAARLTNGASTPRWNNFPIPGPVSRTTFSSSASTW
jgi:ribosomal 30S subunit maturation factor RimM